MDKDKKETIKGILSDINKIKPVYIDTFELITVAKTIIISFSPAIRMMPHPRSRLVFIYTSNNFFRSKLSNHVITENTEKKFRINIEFKRTGLKK